MVSHFNIPTIGDILIKQIVMDVIKYYLEADAYCDIETIESVYEDDSKLFKGTFSKDNTIIASKELLERSGVIITPSDKLKAYYDIN